MDTNYTDEEIKSNVVNELSEALDYISLNISTNQIVGIDRSKGTVTIEFPYYILEEDNYVGLLAY